MYCFLFAISITAFLFEGHCRVLMTDLGSYFQQFRLNIAVQLTLNIHRWISVVTRSQIMNRILTSNEECLHHSVYSDQGCYDPPTHSSRLDIKPQHRTKQ